MKELHLVCESHLDPIWLWEWEEGASAAISTFKSAVNLAKKFDYIFCHNEVTLYQYIEEYAPDLFEEIKHMVKIGKWHIMGGWFLQPDCNMPSGESFVRHILVGRKYFESRFGKAPTTAINFDSFGHTRGLVQIIKKCGQDSYIFCRPFENQLHLPDNFFIWEGFDGSRINVFRSPTYNSMPFGNAANHIKGIANGYGHNHENWLCLWGVGNHGGGPSRKDLNDIKELMDSSDIKIIHSTPEKFFEKAKPNEDCIYSESLRTSMPGCYVSMSNLKRKHIQLENSLFYTEKIMTIANLSGKCDYLQDEFDKVEEDLLNCEFHDMITGDSIFGGAENGLCMIQHGLYILNKLKAKAFFSLIQNEPAAKEGEYPIAVFNPHPYEITTNIECEFGLADQNYDDTIQSRVTIYDNEKVISSQFIKEEANLNLDWRKRVIFHATLPPMSFKRFSAYIDFEPAYNFVDDSKNDIIFSNNEKQIEISRDTGFITKYTVKGKNYINSEAFVPYLYEDNEDPFAMGDFQIACLGQNPMEIKLATNPKGIMRGRKSVQIVENGPVCISVESIFQAENVSLRILYIIYKEETDVDIKINVVWSEKERMLKLHIPTAFLKGVFFGETAYGTEQLFNDGKENPAHRFVAMKENENECLGIINNCIYGCSSKDNTIMLSLIRGAAFGAHPNTINPKPILQDRYVSYLDQGEQIFEFRLTACKEDELARKALEFNQIPYALNIFPTGQNNNISKAVNCTLSNKDIILSTLKKAVMGDGYVVRLFNNSKNAVSTTFSLSDADIKLNFTKYEIKTLIYKNGTLTISDKIVI